MTLWSAIHRKTTAVLGFDPHSVALFRVALAVMVLWTLAVESRCLYEMYDDRGLVPRGVILFGSETRQYEISVFNISGWWVVSAALFLVHGTAAGCMAIGHRTRLAAGVNWFMLVSMLYRHPLPAFAGDTYLRVCSFWALFLPLDAAWAVDAPMARPAREVSPGSVAVLVQMCLMYVASVYEKNGDAWVDTGTAMFHACNIPESATPLSRYAVRAISNYPLVAFLSTWATGAVLCVEYYVPWLMFSPWFPRASKALAAATLVAMHLTFALFFGVWRLSLQFIVPLLCILPTTSLWPPATADARFQCTPKQALAWVVCIVCVCSVAFTTLESVDVFGPPPTKYCRDVVQLACLHDRWNMFSPNPATHSPRYVIEGTLPDASSVRLRLGDPTWASPFDAERDLDPRHNPPSEAVPEPLTRILDVMYSPENIGDEAWGLYRRLLLAAIGKYMCRESPGHRLTGLKIWEIVDASIFMMPTRLHYHTKVIWDHQCLTANKAP